MACIDSPARDIGSAAGLDHVEWAEEIARAVAGTARVIYIEAECFGGTGSQAAVGWQRGVVRFRPRRTQTPTETERATPSSSTTTRWRSTSPFAGSESLVLSDPTRSTRWVGRWRR